MNALPTKLNLYKRGINTNVICPLCDQGVETIIHSLVFCDLARQLWDKWKECPVNLKSNYLDIANIALRIMADGTSQDLKIFFVTAWSLWYSKNQKVFEANIQTPDQVWSFAGRFIQDYKEASNLCNCGIASAKSKWRAPPVGIYKVNVDGATSENDRPSSIGVIIKDNKSETIADMCMPLPGQYTSLETETTAIEKRVLLAKEMGLQ